MQDVYIAFLIGLMAGSIFFIDGWGPTPKGETDFFSSRRFRGLTVLVAGGIITPILDYVTTKKPEFFLAYLKGCIYGWFFVLLAGLALYLIWNITKQRDKQGIVFKIGEFAYSILDFIYLGISDNPHLLAKRDSDVILAQDIYKIERTYASKQREKEIEKSDLAPGAIAEPTKKLLEEQNRETKATKTEADYKFNDWYYKGIAEYEKKEYEKCIVYMKSAIEKDKANENALDAYLYMGLSYDAIGLPLRSIEIYDKLITDYPKHKGLNTIYYDKGVSLAKLGKDEEAIAAYDKALELKPDDADAWNNKGTSFGKLKEYKKAIDCFREAIKSKPGAVDVLLNTAICMGLNELYNDGLKTFEEVIALDPANTKAWNGKGFCLDKLNRYEDSLQAYEEAIRLEPNKVEAWSSKGAILIRLKKYDEALKALNKAIELNPNFGNAWFNITCLNALQNEKDKMLSSLARAVEIDAGFKAEAKKGTEFAPYLNDELFKKLVA